MHFSPINLNRIFTVKGDTSQAASEFVRNLEQLSMHVTRNVH